MFPFHCEPRSITVRDTIIKSYLQRQLNQQYAKRHTATASSQAETTHLKFIDLDRASCGTLPARAVSVMVEAIKLSIGSR